MADPQFRPGWLHRRVAQCVAHLRRVPKMYGGTKPDEPALIPHPFGDRCDHGVQFLNQCDDCPDGWQPRTGTGSQSSAVDRG